MQPVSCVRDISSTCSTRYLRVGLGSGAYGWYEGIGSVALVFVCLFVCIAGYVHVRTHFPLLIVQCAFLF